MNKNLLLAIGLSAVLGLSCDKTDESFPWSANSLVEFGSQPVASPDGERILFIREGVEGGLYLYAEGVAQKLNEGGPSLRADYVWSQDGTRICFSGPGVPGSATAGIYLSTNPSLTEFTRIWDRGSDPVFSRNDDEIICAGPEAGEEEGIWKISLSDFVPRRILPMGVQPALSPDGHKIAYTFRTGGSVGRTLVIYHRQSLTSDTVGAGAVSHSWLDDSQTIIYERVQDSTGNIGASTIYRTSTQEFLPGLFLLDRALGPQGIPGTASFVYTSFEGDIASGIFSSTRSGRAVQIADSGATPYPVSENRILASSPSGIFELTR
jgi:Tol biopolymer transport system component